MAEAAEPLAPERRRVPVRLVVILAIIVAVVLALWLLNRSKGGEPELFTGYVVADDVYMTSPVAGTLASVAVVRGQRVAADARMEGPEAVDAVVGQLEGFEAPAGAWESEILPARLAGDEPTWLDERRLAGHLTWTRLRPRSWPLAAHSPRSSRPTTTRA